jgi:hypothetical protein
MKRIDIPEISRSAFSYENFFNVYETNQGFRFYNLLKNISIFSSNDSEIEDEYITDYLDTWYSISYRVYGTLNLWWLVCLYNNINNPFERIKSKTFLRILKPELVGIVISEITKQINK